MLIQLTAVPNEDHEDHPARPMWINPDHIMCLIHPVLSDAGSDIFFVSGHPFSFVETPEQVVALIKRKQRELYDA